jgi:hypothetical protein
LNEDLFKHPFNEELRELAHGFAGLLAPIIETVDRHGLKARLLGKHKGQVELFRGQLGLKRYETEVATQYIKRLCKYWDKLFTFLDYDDIPWHSNNAEHAVKAFAALRMVLQSSATEKTLQEDLILLSLCETCNYKGIRFLDFLRSERRAVDAFGG